MNIIKHIKDPGSAITHFIGWLGAILAATPLLIRASSKPNPVCVFSAAIFIVSMILLYGASTLYHTFDINEKVNRFLKKLDHSMIFILIAGSYTPVCLLVLDKATGVRLLVLVWSIAIVGMIIKLFWIYCPKWFSSILYIGMGWLCVTAFSPLINNLSTLAFDWLLAGGIIYTVGGVIYALKCPLFNSRHKYFGSHEIFHLFVMAGSFCHFIFVYKFLL
jgi:hemolysin III